MCLSVCERGLSYIKSPKKGGPECASAVTRRAASSGRARPQGPASWGRLAFLGPKRRPRPEPAARRGRSGPGFGLAHPPLEPAGPPVSRVHPALTAREKLDRENLTTAPAAKPAAPTASPAAQAARVPWRLCRARGKNRPGHASPLGTEPGSADCYNSACKKCHLSPTMPAAPALLRHTARDFPAF